MVQTTVDVNVNFLNGESAVIADCVSVNDLRVRIAHRKQLEPPEITVLSCPNGEILVDQFQPVPENVFVILTQHRRSAETWIEAFESYAAFGDKEGCERSLVALIAVDPLCVAQLLLSQVQNGSADCIKTLLTFRNGSSVNTSDGDGNTALILAARKGRKEIVDLLLECSEVDINVEDAFGYNVLHWAVFDGHEDVVRCLLSRKDLRINAHSKSGITPLHNAVRKLRRNVVEMLLARTDVAVNAQSIFGWTPLHCAVHKGEKEVIEMLLAREDVVVNTENCFGLTPLELATRRREMDVIEMLEAKSASQCVI